MRAAGWTAMAMAALAAPQLLAAEAPSQTSLDRFADTLGYQLTMVDNGPECPAGIDACFLSIITLTLNGVERGAVAPALAALGAPETGALPLTIRVDPAAAPKVEGYILDAKASGIAITAHDAAGASHALRSLAQQAAFEKGKLTPLHVEDAPEYGFRGLHIDLGRNFHSRDEILKLVEAMATYKLNKLHLHLAEDEGWRIEIRGISADRPGRHDRISQHPEL